jgi:hypothetical protein
MIGPSSICLGVSWMRRGSGRLDGDPLSAAPGRPAGFAVALVFATASTAAGAARAGQEREPGAVDSCGNVGITVVGGLANEGAVRPSADLVRHVRAAEAQLGCQGHEPLVVVAVARRAGVFDAAQGGQGVGGLVQHDLQHGPAPGRQQLARDEQLGCARLVLAVEYPSFGPVVAA